MGISFHNPVMVGPLRWLVLTYGGRVTTFLFFVKALYTPVGAGTVLFVQSDVEGRGRDDLFAVYGERVEVARFLRDEVWSYTVFAGREGREPAPIRAARFDSVYEFPRRIEEHMSALDGTELTLSLAGFGSPRAYVRDVSPRLREVGAMAVPDRFELDINGRRPVGEPEIGPLSDAPPVGADLQNVWFELVCEAQQK